MIGKLKETGMKNLGIGLAVLLILSAAFRYGIGTVLIYDNKELLPILRTEVAAAFRFYNVLPATLLPAAAFVWMYISYALAAKGVDYGVAARERRHAVVPGAVLIVGQAFLLAAMRQAAAGRLQQGERTYENTIMSAFVAAGIISILLDVILYLFASIKWKPDRLV